MSRVKKSKVFVALSGGVDSSVAAALLKGRGFSVVGVHMRCWYPPQASHVGGQARLDRQQVGHAVISGCCEQVRDAEDARLVAGILGIPFYVFDFEKEYKQHVFDYMIREYMEGRTPNPDVMCNKEIKFGLFLEKARALGADYVATGHYVRLAQRTLSQARDRAKDQSYFLWTLTQDQLRHCLFPIGDYVKQEVRALAKKIGLPTATKKDSQGLCFVGKVDFSDFLREYIPEKKGEVVTACGEPIGEHNGAHYYTIGQRHGFGGGGGEPLYITQKDVSTNIITVAPIDDSLLYKKEVEIRDLNWINEVPQEGKEYMARIRYRQPLQKCKLLASGNSQLAASSPDNKSIEDPRQSRDQKLVVVFSEPQRAVAPGQALVLYAERGSPSYNSGRRSRELRMLGGGFIV